MLQGIIDWIVATVGHWGYFGIVVMMAIESSVFPLPSEVVLIPAGYLAYLGEMNMFLVFLSATLGTLLGALANYFLAQWLGRKFFIQYGKYIALSEEKLKITERFFKNHGEISIFLGRLIPVIRHLISLPAGLAKMNLSRFSIYTTVGGAIWAAVLLLLGYFLGENETLIKEYLQWILIGIFALIPFIIWAYIVIRKRIFV